MIILESAKNRLIPACGLPKGNCIDTGPEFIHLLPILDGRMLDWSFVTPTGESFPSEDLMWACQRHVRWARERRKHSLVGAPSI